MLRLSSLGKCFASWILPNEPIRRLGVYVTLMPAINGIQAKRSLPMGSAMYSRRPSPGTVRTLLSRERWKGNGLRSGEGEGSGPGVLLRPKEGENRCSAQVQMPAGVASCLTWLILWCAGIYTVESTSPRQEGMLPFARLLGPRHGNKKLVVCKGGS